jgi:acyl-coenzyme A synthetase/AMP-(fatty) acid ligase
MDKLDINLLKHHDNVALIVRKEGEQKVVYRDLLKQVLKTSLFIESESDIPKCSTIGILGDKSYALVALSLGIIETDHSFCYLTKDDLDDMNVEYFFSLSSITLSTIELRKTLAICETNIYFYKTKSAKEMKQFNYADNEMNKVCYRITTSGSTGRRKIIHVTFNSIYPNIKGLQEIFKLDHSDVILSASPITFDVFIIDLFLALYSGSSILFLPDNHRFDTSIYFKASDKSVTFLQMTPTIFRQYGLDNIKSKILHSESSLK